VDFVLEENERINLICVLISLISRIYHFKYSRHVS